MFEFAVGDKRYSLFELAGVISKWRLELSDRTRACS
jgi:Tc toxin complex TcA C-terminal TcB-binding domain